jgi:AraC family transcriptional regulator
MPSNEEVRVLAGTFCGSQMAKRQVAGLHIVESVYGADQRVPWHAHQWPYVTFVLRGAYTEDCRRKTWEINAGDVVFHEAGEAHADHMHAADSYLLNLEFTQCWLDRIDGLGARLDSRFTVSGGYFLQLGNRLHRQLWSDERISALCIEGLALELIAEIAHRKVRTSGKERWRHRAVEYLHANFKESPTLQEVAEAAGVHPVHLAREFRRKEGVTVGGYIRKLRVDMACQELIRSKQPIVDIAVKAGFSDHSHLTRVFRRQLGLTPTEFRKLRLGA